MNIKIFKKKDFLLLMISKLVSLLGTQMQEFALSLYVLKITGSATLFASVIIVSLIPQIVLSPIAGVFADWLDRKKVVVYLDLLNGLIVTVFSFIFASSGKLSVSMIYFLVLLLSTSSVLYSPAVSTIIPGIMEKDELMDANGINSIIGTVGALAAPAIAGVLYGIFGLDIILMINAVSFFAAAVCELFINIPKSNKTPEKINFSAFKKDFVEGVRFVSGKKSIITIITMAPILNFVISPLFSTGVIYVSKKVMGISDFEYGMLETVIVSSMLLTPLIANYLSKKFSSGMILFINITISILSISIMGVAVVPHFLNSFSTNIIPMAIFTISSFITISVLMSCNIILSTLFQELVPIQMMGRVSSVMGSVCIISIPLGQAIYGVMLDKVPTWLCIISDAFILLLTVFFMRKSLIKIQSGNEKDKIVEMC